MAESELLAAFKALQIHFDSQIEASNFALQKCISSVNSRFAQLQSPSSPIPLSSFLPPLDSLPPQPTTPTFDELFRKLEVAISNAAVSTTDIGLVDPNETLPSTEPSPGIQSLPFSDESENEVCRPFFPTVHSLPSLSHQDTHHRLSLSKSEWPSSTSLIGSQDKYEGNTSTFISSVPVPALSKCLQFSCVENILQIFFGRAMVIWKEEPPGFLLLEQSLKGHLGAKRIAYFPISSPLVLSSHEDDNAEGSMDISFSLQKKEITRKHRQECVSAIGSIYGDDLTIDGDLIFLNFFALEGWSLAELFHVQCVVAAPYVVPYSAPTSFEHRFRNEFPLLYKYFQEACPGEVGWDDIIHWMWPLFTEDWGKWRSLDLKLSFLPFTDPVTDLPTWHDRPSFPLLLYGFSQEIVECPGYWPSAVRVCGFWYLPDEWQFSCGRCAEISSLVSLKQCSAGENLCPSHEKLKSFLDSSAEDLIFISFSSVGSIGYLRNPQVFIRVLGNALNITNHRFILFTAGYGPLDAAIKMFACTPSSTSKQMESSEIQTSLFDGRLVCSSGEMPYSLLFPRCAAIIHHGGSGTTSSAVHAGVPQIICPFIMNHLGQIGNGYALVFDCHTFHIVVKVVELLTKIDRCYDKDLEKEPKFLKNGNACMLRDIEGGNLVGWVFLKSKSSRVVDELDLVILYADSKPIMLKTLRIDMRVQLLHLSNFQIQDWSELSTKRYAFMVVKLRDSHHLEDKVNFEGEGNDTTIEAISNIHHQPSSEPNPESTNQPKKQEKINPKPGTRRQARNRKIPERLKDYVVD